MVRVLQAHREHAGLDEMTTVEQFDLTYANLRECDPATDIAIVESTAAGADPEVVACSRAFWEDLDSTGRDLVVFTPILPEHVEAALFTEMVVVHRDGRRPEDHMRSWAVEGGPTRFRSYAGHPDPTLRRPVRRCGSSRSAIAPPSGARCSSVRISTTSPIACCRTVCSYEAVYAPSLD
jgi:hypothetical protein